MYYYTCHNTSDLCDLTLCGTKRKKIINPAAVDHTSESRLQWRKEIDRYLESCP